MSELLHVWLPSPLLPGVTDDFMPRLAHFSSLQIDAPLLQLLAQSTAHPVSTLCSRVEGFVHQLCTELLPPRVGMPAKQPPKTDADRAEDANGGAPPSDSEFRKAVEELVKSKLEKPKRCVWGCQEWGWKMLLMLQF